MLQRKPTGYGQLRVNANCVTWTSDLNQTSQMNELRAARLSTLPSGGHALTTVFDYIIYINILNSDAIHFSNQMFMKQYVTVGSNFTDWKWTPPDSLYQRRYHMCQRNHTFNDGIKTTSKFYVYKRFISNQFPTLFLYWDMALRERLEKTLSRRWKNIL